MERHAEQRQHVEQQHLEQHPEQQQRLEQQQHVESTTDQKSSAERGPGSTEAAAVTSIHGCIPPRPSPGLPTANGHTLKPEVLAKIAASREAATKRKAARTAALKLAFPLAAAHASNGKRVLAPDTAPLEGGRPRVSNRRHAENKKAGTASAAGPAWPNDLSLAMNDVSHREAGLFAIDTVNPNAWGGGAEYLQRTSADVVLCQEVKLPHGYPCEAAEQAARNAKWKLSVEPCLVTKAGGGRRARQWPPGATSG